MSTITRQGGSGDGAISSARRGPGDGGAAAARGQGTGGGEPGSGHGPHGGEQAGMMSWPNEEFVSCRIFGFAFKR